MLILIMDFNDIPLVVNESSARFELAVDGRKAFVDFKRKEDTVILVHTEVPAELEGRGVAATLVLKTLEYLDAHHLKLVPACTYIQYFLKRHPEWKKLI
jgi:hypothetical protein